MESTVRKELSGERSLAFSGWIRKQLPQNNFLVTDIDFMLHNTRTNEWMLLEEKTRGGLMKPWQREMYKKLATRLRVVADRENDPFGGIWLITFHGVNAVCPNTSDRIELENLETNESFTVSVDDCKDFFAMQY